MSDRSHIVTTPIYCFVAVFCCGPPDLFRDFCVFRGLVCFSLALNSAIANVRAELCTVKFDLFSNFVGLLLCELYCFT